MPKKINQFSEEHKKKISKALKGKIPKNHFLIGHKHSEETKRKIGKANSIALRGNIPWNKGKTLSEKHKEKLSESHKGKFGINSSNWQGGKSFEPYSVDWTNELRISIRERDHYICQLCGIKQGDRAHAIHHIDYDKKNCNPENLITLCKIHNGKVNKNRNYWKQYFSNKND